MSIGMKLKVPSDTGPIPMVHMAELTPDKADELGKKLQRFASIAERAATDCIRIVWMHSATRILRGPLSSSQDPAARAYASCCSNQRAVRSFKNCVFACGKCEVMKEQWSAPALERMRRVEHALALVRVSNKIQRIREKSGITLRRFAVILGVSPPFLSDVEHGRRALTPARLAKAATELGVQLEASCRYRRRLYALHGNRISTD